MPPENRRSRGYRFVTCGDPNGVVECGSIRMSRAKYQKMEAAVENPRKAKSPVSPGRCAEGPGDGSDVVQLSEVSRGAQNLNRMIETWSRGASFDGQSKDIAKDLLKGALDLQESLVLLGKLQEATKYVAQLKQKAEKSEDPQKDARFQKPRISVNEALGSYKFRRKEFDSLCDVPSTSSSQSSTVNGDDAACYAESGASRSNVIAKLMGLDEIPSIDNRKNSQFSKPRFEVPRLGRELRSLEEILEGMQSKGLLLKSDSVGNRKHGNDDHPPIVLIKPFAAPVAKGKEHPLQEEKILRTEVMLKNAKIKEILRKFSDGRGKVDRPERFSARKKVEEGSRSMKQLPAQVSKKLHKSDAVDRKPGEVQKVRRNSGKEACRSRLSFPDPRRQNYTEPTASRLVRTEHSGPNKIKNETSTPQSRTQKNVIPNRRILEGRRIKSGDRDRSPEVKLITVTGKKDIGRNEISAVECEKIDEENDVSGRTVMDSVTTETGSSTVTSTSMEETDQAVLLPFAEDSNNKQNDSRDAKPATSDNEEIGETDSEHNRALTKRHDGKALLRSDSGFLTRLDDLLESFGIYPTILNIFEKDQSRPVLEKLYLDCANEFIERKSTQVPRNLLPICFASRGIGPPLTSVDKLIEEVCDGIKELNGWCEFAGGHLSADGFHAFLKRDMGSKGFANGTWEFGWKDGFSREDVEQVVADMAEGVLGWLIQEAITEA